MHSAVYRDDDAYLRRIANDIAKLQGVCFDLGLNFYVETHMDRLSEDLGAFCKIMVCGAVQLQDTHIQAVPVFLAQDHRDAVCCSWRVYLHSFVAASPSAYHVGCFVSSGLLPDLFRGQRGHFALRKSRLRLFPRLIVSHLYKRSASARSLSSSRAVITCECHCACRTSVQSQKGAGWLGSSRALGTPTNGWHGSSATWFALQS